MNRAAKPKQPTEGGTAAGADERTSPRFLKVREGDFEIQADFWREIIHVISPKLSRDVALGATLKTRTKINKSPVVTVWLKSLEELRDKRLQTEIAQRIKAALNKSGYSVNFR